MLSWNLSPAARTPSLGTQQRYPSRRTSLFMKWKTQNSTYNGKGRKGTLFMKGWPDFTIISLINSTPWREIDLELIPRLICLKSSVTPFARVCFSRTLKPQMKPMYWVWYSAYQKKEEEGGTVLANQRVSSDWFFFWSFGRKCCYFSGRNTIWTGCKITNSMFHSRVGTFLLLTLSVWKILVPSSTVGV